MMAACRRGGGWIERSVVAVITWQLMKVSTQEGDGMEQEEERPIADYKIASNYY